MTYGNICSDLTSYVNSLDLVRCSCNIDLVIFISISRILCISYEICPQDTWPHLWIVNIGSGNGLVPSGNKPLPEPLLTHIYVGHMVSLAIISWFILQLHKAPYFPYSILSVPQLCNCLCMTSYISEQSITGNIVSFIRVLVQVTSACCAPVWVLTLVCHQCWQ